MLNSLETTLKYSAQEDQVIKFTSKNIAVVGSNGSGKSTLLRELKKYNPTFTIVAAHKNLTLRQGQFMGQAADWLRQNKAYFKSPTAGESTSLNSSNSVQDDYSQIIELIFREYNEQSVEAFNNGKQLNDIERKLDQVMSAWNGIFAGKIMQYLDKHIKIIHGNAPYDIEDLSDGERVALYMLIKVLLAEPSSSIVIDEPETFLNPALLAQLYDQCESLRTDCNFIYFSHDLEFVTTRKDCSTFWIKSFSFPTSWDIDLLETSNIPEELVIKVIGSKKQKILFVESDQNKDSLLYQVIYQDFKIWPVGSCENVINYTKAFNSKTERFNKQYFGLIDSDLRTTEEITSLANSGVYTIPAAIYENLLIAKTVVKFVFEHLGRTDFDAEFIKLETAVKKEINSDNFKTAYTKSKMQQLFNLSLDDIALGKAQFNPDLNIYITEIATFSTKGYDELLALYNQKNLKGCVSEIGYKWEDWQSQVLNIFNTDKNLDFRALWLGIMPKIGDKDV